MKTLLYLIISTTLVVSGYAQTRNVLVGTNNAVVQPTNFWSADASNARTGLGLGTAATSPASAFQPSSTVLSNLASSNAVNLTNIRATNIVGVIPASNIPFVNLTNISGTLTIASGGTGGTNASEARGNLGVLATNGNAIGLTNFPTVPLASNVTGTIAISNGGTGATNASGARTNLGLGATWLTNTVASNFLSAIGLGASQSVAFAEVVVSTALEAGSSSNTVIIDGDGINFGHSGIASTTRTNLGLGWSALTNSNAGTGLVSVNTNGEVVSPTNFWQTAPINTRVQNFTNVTASATNNATNARNLFVFSLAPTVSGITNTIALPTNPASTFEGDVATVSHLATNTNAVTAVRQLDGTNLIILNRLEETVQFIYRGGQWRLSENISHVEPIYFSGTNAAANAAASRTNLGLGATSTVAFYNGYFNFLNVSEDAYFTYAEFSGGSNSVELSASGINFQGAAAATTRTNLGLGSTNIVTFAGLTNNGDITINQTATNNGLLYIRRTNNEAFLGLANLIASNNVTVSNETLFRVGVAEATNKAAQFGFRSTNTNGNGVAVFSVFGYNALMMIGPSDPDAGTNPIEATVYSVNPTNKVMTLIKTNTGATLFHRAIEVENTTNQAVTRTNLGLPLAALTNTSVTNFQKAIFYTNAAPSNIGGNLGTIAAWIEIVASNGVTYKIPAYTNIP